ncbi:hypothetical protein ACW4FP_19880 (plasmid) [Paenarthrobacter ureafaciens]
MVDRFAPELKNLADDTEVTVTGYVKSVRKFTEHFGVWIRDAFGDILLRIERAPDSDVKPPKKGDRLRVEGRISTNDKGEPVVCVRELPELLGNSAAVISELSDAMRDQAAKMLVAQAVRHTTAFLLSENFVEFESRVISTQWSGTGLEPMKVIYPGFGCPVPLTTSPAAQVVDFINTVGVRRAFTSTISFSTTYRFPEGSSDLRVIVGRVAGIQTEKLQSMLTRLIQYVLAHLNPEGFAAQNSPGSPASRTAWTSFDYKDQKGLVKVMQVLLDNGFPVVESFAEELGDHDNLHGFTVYPDQFVSLLAAMPARNLRDLRGARVW